MEDRRYGEIFHFLAEAFPGDAVEEEVDAVVRVHQEEADGLREELTRGGMETDVPESEQSLNVEWGREDEPSGWDGQQHVGDPHLDREHGIVLTIASG